MKHITLFLLAGFLMFTGINKVYAQPANDDFANAITIPHQSNWCSSDAAYTNVDATGDLNAGSCWVIDPPERNVWFKFQANASIARVTIKTGGTYGTIRRINAAIWEADGTSEVTCGVFKDPYDSIVLQTMNLVYGQWYYISVDNQWQAVEGTFTVCMDMSVDYDYYEGAIEIPHQTGWFSGLAEYTTVGATPDRNAGSCWTDPVQFNRWFRFQATSTEANFIVEGGGTYGTASRFNVAFWESNGTTEVACGIYSWPNFNLTKVNATGLTVGNWYYISIDNNDAINRGTFTIGFADYDWYEGAITIPHQDGWCSADAEYTTIGATADRNAGSCWNTNPNYNRWFKFQATDSIIKLTVKRGGPSYQYGTIRRINAAIWEADGTTEVICSRYINDNDNVTLQYQHLTVGNWYYLSVDNNYSYYRGSFTLCMQTSVDYDFYEGAITIPSIVEWCSTDAEYSTYGATSDKNAASCWNTNPNYNRWFKFQATTTGKATITVLRGGSFGTIRRINVALWESDGLTEVACNRYVYDNDNVTIQVTGLTEGNWYYISVDNNYSYYRGSFTLCVDDDRVKWVGNISNDWGNAGNWSGGIIPSVNDDIVLSEGRTYYPETNTGANANVKSLILKPNTYLTIPAGKSLVVINELTLESDATGNSSIIDNGTLYYDNTKSAYQTYLSEDTWHLISSPVTNAVSGVYLNIYLKYFSETDSTWNYIVPVNYPLTPGKGFAEWAASSLTGPTTVSYEGTFNTGDVTPPALTYTPGAGTGDGWNLLGNPYPSAVEWNSNWSRTNVDATVYVYNGSDGQYYNWNATLGTGTMGNGEIPPAQGFWVKANAASPAITIPQSERVHTSKNFYKSSGVNPNILNLSVTGNGYGDKLIIGFNNSATTGFDHEFDAYKLPGRSEAPQMFAVEGDYNLSMDILPVKEEVTVPVNFTVNVEGKYTISVDDVESFAAGTEIYLEDLAEGKITDLNKTKVYEFMASPLDEPGRFLIHFEFKSGIDTPDTDEILSVKIYSAEKDVYVAVPAELTGSIEVYDIMGQLVASKTAISGTLNKITVRDGQGIYIVRMTSPGHIFSNKVFIK